MRSTVGAGLLAKTAGQAPQISDLNRIHKAGGFQAVFTAYFFAREKTFLIDLQGITK